MKNVNFDLQEALATSIMDNTGLKLKIAYLAPDDEIGIVPEQGSHKLQADYSGREYWVYNYAITMRNKSPRQIKENLFKINFFLNSLQPGDIKSKDNSFIFDKVDVSSAPSEIQEDTSDTVTYLLDVAVFVYIDN